MSKSRVPTGRAVLCARIVLLMVCGMFALRAAQASGDHGPEIQQRIASLTNTTSLLGVDRPWHLKVEITLYDETGAISKSDTIERWQNGQDSRTLQTFDGITQVAVERAGKSYRDPHERAMPQVAETLFHAVIHPGPSTSQLAESTAEVRPTTVGGQKLSCIMLSRKMKLIPEAPLGLFPTYCLSQDDHLLVVYHFGGQTIVREKLGKFLEREVTTQASLFQDRTLLGKARVLQLSTFSPAAGEFDRDKELVEVGAGASERITGAVMAGYKIKGSVPIYPEQDRLNRVSGSVVLQAIIGRDGRIYDLTPVSAPDAALALSAITAVRDWTYSPYLLNGVPVEVTTTITVNYNIGPG